MGKPDFPGDVSLQALLRDRDVACPRCRYNLRDLPSSRCPECGLSVSVDALLVRRAFANFAWLALLLSLAVGWAESFAKWRDLLWYGKLDYGSVLDPRLGEGGYLLYQATRYASQLYWVGLLPAGMLLIGLRRWFVRLPRPVQWCLAAVGMALTVLAHRRLAPAWR